MPTINGKINYLKKKARPAHPSRRLCRWVRQTLLLILQAQELWQEVRTGARVAAEPPRNLGPGFLWLLANEWLYI